MVRATGKNDPWELTRQVIKVINVNLEAWNPSQQVYPSVIISESIDYASKRTQIRCFEDRAHRERYSKFLVHRAHEVGTEDRVSTVTEEVSGWLDNVPPEDLGSDPQQGGKCLLSMVGHRDRRLEFWFFLGFDHKPAAVDLSIRHCR